MPKRSSPALSVVFSDSLAQTRGSGTGGPRNLPVFDMDHLHFHRYTELGVCVGGEGVCRVEDAEYPFRAGDTQVIFPFQRHLSRNAGSEKSKWYWAYIDLAKTICDAGIASPAAVEAKLQNEMSLCGIIDGAAHPRVASLVNRIVREIYDPEPGLAHPDESFALGAYSLVLALCDASDGLPRLSLRGGRVSGDVAPALDAVRSCVERGEVPRVAALAETCGMSEPNFRRVFARATGLSPKSYIRSCFMRKAQLLLLTTDAKISEIAQSAGYEDVSGFNRCFREFFGAEPRELRRRGK